MSAETPTLQAFKGHDDHYYVVNHDTKTAASFGPHAEMGGVAAADVAADTVEAFAKYDTDRGQWLSYDDLVTTGTPIEARKATPDDMLGALMFSLLGAA